MSVYSKPGKGWRYDFTLKGQRHTEAWFKTKTEAKRAEALKREEVLNPKEETMQTEEKGFLPEKPTGMEFLELVNRRLDHVKAYNSESHYRDYVYMAKRWVKLWGRYPAEQISRDMIENFVQKRSLKSRQTANKEIRYLRATFNFGVKRGYIEKNPTSGMDFLPVEKRIKYVPLPEDIDKLIAAADPETQDYLWVLRETLARVSEINRLIWDDVDLKNRFVVLYTRKKKGGNLTPRKVFMTEKLFEILSRRYADAKPDKPWVFWHRYWSRKSGKWITGPYKDRKTFMKNLCKNAGIKYFRFHALRHAGSSLMDASNVPIGAIQRILGHENRTTTEIYLHSIGDSEKLAMAVYEQARQKKSHTDSHTEKKRG